MAHECDNEHTWERVTYAQGSEPRWACCGRLLTFSEILEAHAAMKQNRSGS